MTRAFSRPLTHLIISREYPPAPYPAGGIGTYIRHISQLLAEAGETVHVLAQRWDGAPQKITESCNGRLIVHRVALDEPVSLAAHGAAGDTQLLKRLAASNCPSQLFSWQAAHYAEALIRDQPIDLVEAQEWEAPLYYLQLRRALGLGPGREPPCLVHLHSPSQLIFEHNAWDQTLTDFLPLRRFEDYSIKSADALLCPSHYLARGISRLFHINQSNIHVIPYPMGDTPFIEREPEVWAHNAVCYIGRLELRKGVAEWVDAAVKAAASHPLVSFDFLGSDTSYTGGAGRSVREYLETRIPRSLRARFRFHGVQSRAGLLRFLSQVSIAVVPSRWENLPFTCIEAMATGLPVLASPTGGMSELITDGESGWIAFDQSSAGLEAALQRALRTPASRRAAMGKEASASVRRICDNQAILTRQLSLRHRVVETGTLHSRSISTQPITYSRCGRQGIGILVSCLERAENLAHCLDSIALQSLPSSVVLVIAAHFRDRLIGLLENVQLARTGQFAVFYTSDLSPDAARLSGLNELLRASPQLRVVMHISQDARLDRSCALACDSAFSRRPRIGLVSSWILREEHYLDTGPVLLDETENCVGPPWFAIRAEVLLAAQHHSTTEELTLQTISRTLTEGNWTTVTYPATLVSLHASRKPSHRRYSVMALAQSGSARFAFRWLLTAPWRERIRWARRSLVQPKRIARWLLWQARSRLA
jgi:glycogen(starch) synthase